MYSKRVNKLHMLTEIWSCENHIVKLWFTFLMLRDEQGYISEGIKQIHTLCKMPEHTFQDALDYLMGNHQDNSTKFIIIADDNRFRINCMDKKEKNRIDLMPKWKEKTKEGFEAYQRMTKKAFHELVHDYHYMLDLKEFYPNHEIIKSIQNSFTLYWGTHQAWLKKRRERSININWRETIRKTLKYNLVKRDRTVEDYEYKYLVEKVKSQSKIIDNELQ